MVIRVTSLARIEATRVLFYQLAVSAALLPLVSRALGEPGVIAFSPVGVASLVYQYVVVAFASYLTWFWLLTRYLGGRLSVFAFLTPLFGVAFGQLVLGDRFPPTFLGAVALVGAGIALVNTRTPAKQSFTVADGEDLVLAHAARRLHLGGVALGLADQRARDRRADRDQALLQVGLVVADDLVGDLVAGLLVLQLDGRAEHDAAVGVELPPGR